MGGPKRFIIKTKNNFKMRKSHLIGEPWPKVSLFMGFTSIAIIFLPSREIYTGHSAFKRQPSGLNLAGFEGTP